MTPPELPSDPAAVAVHFAELHQGPSPLLLANAWDAGTAKALAFLGFRALATTSHAASLGRHDGTVTRELREQGTYGFWDTAGRARAVRGAFDN